MTQATIRHIHIQSAVQTIPSSSAAAAADTLDNSLNETIIPIDDTDDNNIYIEKNTDPYLPHPTRKSLSLPSSVAYLSPQISKKHRSYSTHIPTLSSSSSLLSPSRLLRFPFFNIHKDSSTQYIITYTATLIFICILTY